MIPFLALLLVILAWLPSDFYVAAMPVIGDEFHVSVNDMQWTLSLFLLGFCLTPLLFGISSDKWGRKNILFIGLGILLFGTVVCALSFNLTSLLIGRLLQGIGAAACLTLSRSILRDNYSGRDMARMSALIGIGIELTSALAPALGGIVTEHWGWRTIFYSCIPFLLFSILLIISKLPETHVTRLTGHYLSHFKTMLSHRSFWAYTLCGSIALAIVLSYFFVSPFLLQGTLQLSPQDYGLATLLVTFGVVVGVLFNIITLRYLSISSGIIIGLSIILIASTVLLILSLAFPVNLYRFIIPCGFITCGCAFLFASASAGALQYFPHMAGIASATYSMLQVSGAFLLTSILTLTPHDNDLSLALTYLLSTLVSLTIFICWHKKT